MSESRTVTAHEIFNNIAKMTGKEIEDVKAIIEGKILMTV